MDAHIEKLLANKAIGWVYHPDKHMEVLVEKDGGCEVQSPDTDYRPRQRPINYPRELKIDSDSYRVEGFVFEGFVQYMYLDCKGEVTIGIGHHVENVEEAKKLEFYKRPDEPGGITEKATSEEKEKAFNTVLKSKLICKHHTVFKDMTNLRLDPGDIENRFETDVKEFIHQLRGHFTEFDTYPKMAQLGLLDLIYNMGYGNFIGTEEKPKFKKLRKALAYRNWKEVAEQSHRQEKNDKGETMEGVVERNKIVHEWFLKASEEDPFFIDPNCGPPKNASVLVG